MRWNWLQQVSLFTTAPHRGPWAPFFVEIAHPLNTQGTGVLEEWVSWSRVCWGGRRWVCPREGSWGVGPPVWMCPCKSGCGRTHKGASVDVSEHTCGMCVAHVPWPLSQPPAPPAWKTWTSPFSPWASVLFPLGFSVPICNTVRGSRAPGLGRWPGGDGRACVPCPSWERGASCRGTRVCAFPGEVLTTFVDPKGKHGWRQCLQLVGTLPGHALWPRSQRLSRLGRRLR